MSVCWPLTLLLTLQKGRSAMPWSSMRVCLILRGSSRRMSCCSSCPMLTLAEAVEGGTKTHEVTGFKRLKHTTEQYEITSWREPSRWQPGTLADSKHASANMYNKMSVLHLECRRKKAEAWRWGWLWPISSSSAPPAPSSPPPSAAPWRAYETTPQTAEAAPPSFHTASCKIRTVSFQIWLNETVLCQISGVWGKSSCTMWRRRSAVILVVASCRFCYLFRLI